MIADLVGPLGDKVRRDGIRFKESSTDRPESRL
jgi:hypothetical protein